MQTTAQLLSCCSAAQLISCSVAQLLSCSTAAQLHSCSTAQLLLNHSFNTPWILNRVHHAHARALFTLYLYFMFVTITHRSLLLYASSADKHLPWLLIIFCLHNHILKIHIFFHSCSCYKLSATHRATQLQNLAAAE